MAQTYLVLRGIDYRGRRKEPGQSVNDLTDKEARGLLARGVIEKKAKKGKTDG